MMDKVSEKHALDCETKIFTRKRNTPNDSIYEELKTLCASSFSGVTSIVLFSLLGTIRFVFEGKGKFTGKIHY